MPEEAKASLYKGKVDIMNKIYTEEKVSNESEVQE